MPSSIYVGDFPRASTFRAAEQEQDSFGAVPGEGALSKAARRQAADLDVLLLWGPGCGLELVAGMEIPPSAGENIMKVSTIMSR